MCLSAIQQTFNWMLCVTKIVICLYVCFNKTYRQSDFQYKVIKWQHKKDQNNCKE